METAKDFKVPPDKIEYQVLYGMAEPLEKALVKARVPVRVYAPLGEAIPGMAYLVRRLLEMTSRESFLWQRFGEGVPKAEQLKNPGVKHRPRLTADDTPKDAEKPFQNEPQRDWSIEKTRARFGDALRKAREKFPLSVPVVINGEAITTVREILTRNPNDGNEVVGVVFGAGIEEAESAILSAADAFPKWRDTDPANERKFCSKRPLRREKCVTNWPRFRFTKSERRGTKRTPTCARESISWSTTLVRRSALPFLGGWANGLER
jgi:RHH-type proline utilization regulon transcriptional repressor/proline dehydrogenase/delta 1-pyrroline-5-carboxylate dehydrogenase